MTNNSELKTHNYKLVAQQPTSTVVAKYPPDLSADQAGGATEVREKRAEYYQSEDALEKAFIKQLELQAYEYLPITDARALENNLRTQLEKLNNYSFTQSEWEQFFNTELANPNQSIIEKTTTIAEDYIKNLTLEDGTVKNIYLLDKKNIHNNQLQVINQYATDAGTHSNRYDVTVLVNGLPMVHIELKRRGVAITEAFNQINRYARESFWADSGLFEFVQLFVISNGTHTKYYSNTTRARHIKEGAKSAAKVGKKSSNSFEFTSWWADAANRPITDLMDFAKTFFAKHALLNILTRYCVFTADKELMVMRPYQIVATERILNRIEISTHAKTLGKLEAGGYIWHTTGSGKTLTSFKTAQLASRLPHIDKVLFVVDRKDLDYQTMREYDKFEKGAANSNTSTRILTKQLENPNAKIIITTIQKLDRFIKKNKGHAIFSDHYVIIFDECHRSQYGDMHTGITKTFKKYHLFGFTGTPIFAINSSSGGKADLRTTEQAFGDNLHTYTIVDAIADKNVLPFKVDYISTMREEENIEDKKVSAIDREAALASAERLSNIVGYIREHFDQKTKRNSFYKIKDRRLAGFNSIFTVSSIDVAKKYYLEFKKQLEGVPSDKQLKIATIFSYSANEEEADGVIDDENSENTTGLDAIDYMGFENATPIQVQAIPKILNGEDLIACAQTGTGKTAAFLLPLLDMLIDLPGGETTTLIIVPTRELAMQIDQQVQGIGYTMGIHSIAIYGGGDADDWGQQRRALTQGADIVVATPGKLISHLNLGYVKFDTIKFLILDEADRMLDIGFHDDLMKIISYLPKERQTLMFSATMAPKIRSLASNILVNPAEINIAMSKPAEGVLQAAYLIYNQQKNALISHLISENPEYNSILIFCSTKRAVTELARTLKKQKFAVEPISSDLEQSEREEVVQGFRSKRIRILVATDVMSRGIDIKDINLVINYDVPQDAEDYVHRVGRTARADATGVALTLVNEDDMYKFHQIQELIEREVFKIPMPKHLGTGPDWKKPSPHGKHRKGNFNKGKKGGRPLKQFKSKR